MGPRHGNGDPVGGGARKKYLTSTGKEYNSGRPKFKLRRTVFRIFSAVARLLLANAPARCYVKRGNI